MDIVTLIIAIVVLAFVLWMVYLVKTGKKEAKEIALSLVLEAEQRWIEKSGQGPIKYAYVVGQLKSWMPIWLKPFMSDKVLDVIIDESLDFMKDQLQPNIK